MGQKKKGRQLSLKTVMVNDMYIFICLIAIYILGIVWFIYTSKKVSVELNRPMDKSIYHLSLTWPILAMVFCWMGAFDRIKNLKRNN